MSKVIFETKKVYDRVLRLIHAWNGLAIIMLLLTAWCSELFEKGLGEKVIWQLHILLGYALIVGWVARIVWGVVGPSHARLTDMWHPRAWWNAVRHFQFKVPSRFGHNVLASGLYLAFYLSVFAAIVSGLALAAIEHTTGPLAPWLADSVWWKDLFKEPHEVLGLVFVAFIVVHLGAIILHENVDKTPIAQSMVTGFQYRSLPRDKNEVA